VRPAALNHSGQPFHAGLLFVRLQPRVFRDVTRLIFAIEPARDGSVTSRWRGLRHTMASTSMTNRQLVLCS
jgi:hypothetical protein